MKVVRQHDNTSTALDRLVHYLELRNFDLEFSDERLNLFKDLNNDPVLIEYFSSDLFRSKQVKNKNDQLSEQHSESKILDAIAYYILKSEFKNEKHKEAFESDLSGSVLNNNLENNKAYKRDYRIKETERNYGYPIMSKYAVNRNRSDNYQFGKNKQREIYATDYVKQRFPKSHCENEADAFDLINGTDPMHQHNFDTYSRLVYSLKEPKNVLLFFRYEYELLSEVSGFPESDVRLVSNVLEDIVQEIVEGEFEECLIQFLKDGLDYQQIKNRLNELDENKYTYDMVRYKISDILQRISDRISEKIKNIKEFSQKSVGSPITIIEGE